MNISRLALLVLAHLGTAGLSVADKEADKPRGTIAFASQSPRGWDVYVASVKTGATEKLTGHPALDFNAAVSPDGKRIAFIDGIFPPGRFSLAIMNADGSAHKRIWTGTTDLFSMSWAHSGDLLAFSRGGYFRDAKTTIDIATIRPDGSDLKTLIADGSNNGWLSFAPDGKQFVFRSGRGGAKNLYIANRDGSGIRPLTKGNWTDTMCHWSPTGEWIVFASNRDGDFHLWLIKPDGFGLCKLLGGARHNHPHFSPDGKWVVFASGYAGTSVETVSQPRTDEPFGELFAVRVDGTGLMRLTHNGFSEGTPDWGPAATK